MLNVEPPIKHVSPEDLTFNREESCEKPCLPWKDLARASSLDQLERDDFLETTPWTWWVTWSPLGRVGERHMLGEYSMVVNEARESHCETKTRSFMFCKQVNILSKHQECRQIILGTFIIAMMNYLTRRNWREDGGSFGLQFKGRQSIMVEKLWCITTDRSYHSCHQERNRDVDSHLAFSSCGDTVCTIKK